MNVNSEFLFKILPVSRNEDSVSQYPELCSITLFFNSVVLSTAIFYTELIYKIYDWRNVVEHIPIYTYLPDHAIVRAYTV